MAYEHAGSRDPPRKSKRDDRRDETESASARSPRQRRQLDGSRMTPMRKPEPGNRKEDADDNTKRHDFRWRTKSVALRTIRLVEALPKKPSALAIGNQLLRSAMSVGANHRAAKRAPPRPNSPPRWESLKRNWTSAFIGWNFSSNRGYFPRIGCGL